MTCKIHVRLQKNKNHWFIGKKSWQCSKKQKQNKQMYSFKTFYGKRGARGKNDGTLEKLRDYGKNYGTMPKTMELWLTMEKKLWHYEKKPYGIIVNYS